MEHITLIDWLFALCNNFSSFMIITFSRQEYDLMINRIKVFVGWSEYFTYNSLLHLKTDTSEDVAFSIIEIDKRKTFGHLKAAIFEVIFFFQTLDSYSINTQKHVHLDWNSVSCM